MSERDDTGRETHSSGPEHEPSEERGEAAWSTPAPASAPGPEQDRRRTPSPAHPGADRRRTETPGAGEDRRRTEPPGPAAERFRSQDPAPGVDRRRTPAPVDPAAPPASSPPPWATAETYVSVPVPPLHFPPGTPPPTSPSAPPHVPAGTGAPAPVPSAFPSSGAPYGSPPSPSARRNGGRAGALIVAMVVLGAGSGFGVWWVTRDHGSGGEAGPSVSVTATVSDQRTSSSGSPSAGSPEGSPARAAPDGYRLAEDPAGYALHVPEDWSRRQKQGETAVVVFYDAPSDGRQLQIFALAESTPADSLDLAENDPGYGYSRQPGYRALDRSEGDGWVELSYRYDDKDKGTRQVIDHRFEAADGTLYAIRVSGPDGLDPDQVRAPLEAAVNSFCPKGSQCS